MATKTKITKIVRTVPAQAAQAAQAANVTETKASAKVSAAPEKPHRGITGLKTSGKPLSDKAKAEKTAEQRGVTVFTPASKALSLDTGIKVLALLSKSYMDNAKGEELILSAVGQKNMAQALLTDAIVHLARGDERVLALLSKSMSDDKTGKNVLNDVCRVGLGVLTIEGKAKIVPAAAKKYFGTGKEAAGSAEAKRVDNVRTNFIHALKRAQQNALGVLDMNAEVKLLPDKGTVAISGPGVVKIYGQDNVVLDERKDETLKAAPSFAELRRRAGEKRGNVPPPAVTTTRSNVAPEGDVHVALQGICASAIAAITRMEKHFNTDDLRSLRSLQAAIGNVLAPIVTQDGKPVAAKPVAAPVNTTTSK